MALEAIFFVGGSRPAACLWIIPITSFQASSDARRKGRPSVGCPASVFFLLEAPGPASVWVTRSSQEVPSPAPPSIQDDSPEPSEVMGPLAPLFPVVLGAVAPCLLGLCCCWSVLGCSMGPGGTNSPSR